MSISDEIRSKLNSLDETVYRIAKDSGVTWPTLKRFMDGGGMQSQQLDKIVDYLGLVLVPASEHEKPKPKRKK